ncbi:MAG: NAD(P)/FAD-dependent oxidoreductase [Candidatus Atribacteria bacterium]|nr:NAD(P)/FAD-dependent oxidoreductase [Candidatus Atribacteria bacterium]
MNKPENVLIVGGGISGLATASYLSKFGLKVTILEKEKIVGGYFRSFKENGFFFDAGIRAVENSGIIIPFLKEIGIFEEVNLKKDPVSLGIADDIFDFSNFSGFESYSKTLKKYFKDNTEEIDRIMSDSEKISRRMDVLYGKDFPIFQTEKPSLKKLFTDIIPWLIQVNGLFKEIGNKKSPMSGTLDEYLRNATSNASLRMIIEQHFFEGIPLFFGLGYARLFFDYYYPYNGMGSIPDKLKNFIERNGGSVLTEKKVVKMDFDKLIAYTEDGDSFKADTIVWACDLKSLYRMCEKDVPLKSKVLQGKPQESVFTCFIGSSLPPDYFIKKNIIHSIYTPRTDGINPDLKFRDPNFMENTTYEISVPAARNPSLCDNGGSGVVVSTLMDYEIFREVRDRSDEEYKELKEEFANRLLSALKPLFPELEDSVEYLETATPLTLEERSGNSGGAISGWAMPPQSTPVSGDVKNVNQAILTPFKDIYQTGHWVMSPSGAPTAVLTAKLLAHKISGLPIISFK